MAAFTTEFTQAHVDALTRAISLGVLETEHNGKRTRFQSLSDMLDLRDRMKLEIAAADAAANPPERMPSMTRRTIFFRD